MPRQTGSKASTRLLVKYFSTMGRQAVCSGGSMPFGTVRRLETALLKVAWSSTARVTSALRKSDHCM